MGELARWNLKVSRETDLALRTLLATRGGRKGDLSRFVEEAVNREQSVQSHDVACASKSQSKKSREGLEAIVR